MFREYKVIGNSCPRMPYSSPLSSPLILIPSFSQRKSLIPPLKMATRFLTLCLATAVAAAPAFVPRTINGTAFDVERGLLPDEILLFGEDHSKSKPSLWHLHLVHAAQGRFYGGKPCSKRHAPFLPRNALGWGKMKAARISLSL